MKKVILAGLMVAALSVGANAQKGSVLLYGNLDISTKNNNGGGQFSVNPGVGYQFNNNWTVGVEGGYNYLDNGGNSSIDRSYQLGAFIRQAVPLSPIFAYYTQLGVGYAHQKESLGSSSSTSNGVAAYITPNIGVNLKNGFALNFGFGGLTYNTSKPSGGVSSNTLELTFGKGAQFGISKNFGGANTEHHHRAKHNV